VRASYNVSLVGFSHTEAATFESFFRLAARRPPAYLTQDEVLTADVLVVNGDNPQAIDLVRFADLSAPVLLIGSHDAGTGWLLVRRPVKLVGVLGALDALMRARPSAAPARAPTAGFAASQLHALDASMRLASGRRRNPDTEFPPTRPMVRGEVLAAAVPVARPKPAAEPAPRRRADTDFAGLDLVPAARGAADDDLPPTPRGEALLVAQNLVEGRILLKRFRKYGLEVDWSREPQQALAMMRAHPYRLVVIDRVTGQPDGLQICREAKQTKGPKGAPVVIMFAPSIGSMERMKASLAGSDATLSRSVSESDLYKVLGQHRLVSLNGFAPTNVGGF